MSSSSSRRFRVKVKHQVIVDIGCSSCRRRRSKLSSLLSTLTLTKLLKRSNPSVKLTPYPLSSSSSTTTTTTTQEVQTHKNPGKNIKKKAVVEESLAVVKESSEPYDDFRESMVQMIVEEELYAWEDLNHLLQRFLALNSPQHHHLILGAFADVWDRVYSHEE